VRRAALAAVLVAVAAGAVLVSGVDPQRADPEGPPKTPAPRVLSAERLAGLHWDELQEVLAADVTALESLLDTAGLELAPAASYLRALMRLARGEPETALEALASIPVEAIPPAFLYAPYRLHGELRSGAPNPYLAPLRAAVEAGAVGPLVRARVRSLDGNAAAALTDYLKTDPSRWTRRDVVCIAAILRHEGLARDARALVAGALGSGRVADPLRGPLSFLVIRRERDDALAARELRLREGLRGNGAAAGVAAESARLILELRRRFLARDYRGVLALYPDSAPSSLSTETILLTYLSSMALGDHEAGEPWALELRRRHPEPEVLDWLSRSGRPPA
jgi:hypothetical protein